MPGQSCRRTFSRVAGCCWCLVLGVVAAAGSEELRLEPVDEDRDRTVPVKIYLPDENEQPVPVILFSHGLGGSRENSRYLGQHWSEAGFVCVFLQHPGSDERVWRDAPAAERRAALQAAASGRQLVHRIGDVSFVLDQLEAWHGESGHSLEGRLDLERVGMSGHSFGGVTTEAVMGRRYPGGRSYREPRLDAFLIMSPSVGNERRPERAFGHIEAPALCMTGTADGSPINPDTTPESRREVYAALPQGDKYELVFEGGEHFAFSDRTVRGNARRQDHHHPVILRLSTAFWKAYLQDDGSSRAWLQSDQARENLLDADVWQWK